MVAAQFALAHHATVHLTDHGVHAHHEKHQDQKQISELCQICVFSKNTSHALTPDVVIVQAALYHSSYDRPVTQSHITREASQGYLARGPPTFLS